MNASLSWSPLLRVVLASFVIGTSACQPVPMISPSVEGSHRPYITLNNPVASDGAVDKTSVETLDTCTDSGYGCAFAVFVTRRSRLQLSGITSDPAAGIKSVHLTAISNGQSLFDLHAANGMNASGQAPSQLGFAGSDNSGGFGVVSPILIDISDYVTVTIEAMNFEGNINKLVVNYVPLDPVTASIAVTPSTINQNDIATLSVSGSPSSTWSIDPPIALVPWAIGVSPQHTTTYSLTVTQPFPGIKVGFPNAPPATGQTIHPTTATAYATLTVKEPPPPAANPADLLFYLQLQPFGPSTINPVWAGTLGQGSNGSLVAVRNHNPFAILLVADGHDSEECFSEPDAGVILQAMQQTTSSELTQLYSSNTGFA
jgi:hypothetical protein